MKFGIALLTLNRLPYTLRTIEAVIKKLYCEGVDFGWYIADAGSGEDVFRYTIEYLSLNDQKLIGHHHKECSPGKNWNDAYNEIYKHCDVVLRLENDWELSFNLNIGRYLDLLDKYPEVGMIRLCHLAKGSRLEVTGFDGEHYLVFHRSSQYAFSGNPGLIHKRFWLHYGEHNESTNPGDTEVDYDSKFRSKPGPEIIWPVALGGWGAFGHIGNERSY